MFKGYHWIETITCICAIIIAVLFPNYIQLKSDILKETFNLNGTVNGNQSFLCFNRVPKAGSETLWTILDKLGPRNGFKSFSDSQKVKKSRGAENTFMQYEEQKAYVEMFDVPEGKNMTLPFSYVKHMNFLNFEDFNKTNPIYINMVRHPIDRVISWYYYTRQNWYQLDHDPVK